MMHNAPYMKIGYNLKYFAVVYKIKHCKLFEFMEFFNHINRYLAT